MDMTGAMPIRGWLVVRDAGTGQVIETIESRISGGSVITELPAGRPGAEVELIRRLEWRDGRITEDEPEVTTLSGDRLVEVVQMG